MLTFIIASTCEDIEIVSVKVLYKVNVT